MSWGRPSPLGTRRSAGIRRLRERFENGIDLLLAYFLEGGEGNKRLAPSNQRLTPFDVRRELLLHIHDEKLRPVAVQPRARAHQSEASDFEGERGSATILGVSGAKHPTAQHLPGCLLRVMRRE